MNLKWSAKGLGDLTRLHEFLSPVNPPAAAATVRNIVRAAEGLAQFPRRGERLPDFAPREIRRLIVGEYEIRYEVRNETVYVLRIWHGREHR